MPKLIKSDRLILRPLSLSDYSFIRSLHSNPDVMKYISAGRMRSEQETRENLEKVLLMGVQNPVLGGWIVVLRETMEEVGNVIIRKPATREEMEGVEIGYSFLPKFWGKGYATEAAKCMIDYAYRELGNIKIVALIDPEHLASRNTLLKLGFKTAGYSEYIDPSTGVGLPTEVLEIAASS